MKVSMKDFDMYMKHVNSTRPFKMYIHGTHKDVGDSILGHKSDFLLFDRDCIESTASKCGTINTDYHTRFKDYTYVRDGTGVNIILIMPDSIQIDLYAGSVEGQQNTTLGYRDLIDLDYKYIAATYLLEGVLNKKMFIRQTKKVPNCFILGYYDLEKDEFDLNSHCILFAKEGYDQFIADVTKAANDMYNYCARIRCIGTDRKGRRIVDDPYLYKEFRIGAHKKYLESDEYKYDSDIENTDRLVDPYNLSTSHIKAVRDEIILELEQSAKV